MVIRESYFRRAKERKLKGLSDKLYKLVKNEFGRFGPIVYKANTDS